jgi:hypothetical protein
MLTGSAISTDDAVVPYYYTGSGAPSISCTAGRDIYTDTTNLILYFCRASNVWQAIGRPDPTVDQTVSGLVEEFSTGSASSGSVGSTGLYHSQIGSSGTLAFVSGSQNNPGLLRITSAASAGTGDYIGVGNASTNSPVALSSFLNTDWEIQWVVVVGTNSTTVADIRVRSGMFTPATLSTANGIHIRYDTSLSDATWMFVLCNATGAAGCDSPSDAANARVASSTIAPVAGTAYRLSVRRRSSGVGGNPTYYFRVNNETEKTFCASGCDETLTGLPSSGLVGVGFQYVSNASSVKSADLDLLTFHMRNLSRF